MNVSDRYINGNNPLQLFTWCSTELPKHENRVKLKRNYSISCTVLINSVIKNLNYSRIPVLSIQNLKTKLMKS